ncbi:lysylphosphatidylglycerol synthase domain-containing protein [Acidithiobacillus sp. AMEEHan]|uniref:lysylphosphatidylglycerol synthase domain-containing protein n=1 Tax=Acidithiobacillus sp. AMEEHan TaxID=2994951 RepID=UPI0027E568D8|nr:lysylphosphatidylglycerol synthase domain-containing protein [Acidithiobacillus sp. AMEEHan]
MRAADLSFFRYRGIGSAALLSFGLLFTAWLVWHEGAHGIVAILRQSSWLIWLLLPAHALAIGLDALSWRWLLASVPGRPALPRLTWLALLREAVNGLLPVARVGGEFVGIRLLARMGVSLVQAAASVVVEVSLTLLSQFLFVLLGFVLLLDWAGDLQLQREILYALLAVMPVLALLFWLQGHFGLFHVLHALLRRVSGGRDFSVLIGDPRQLDAEVLQIYRRRWPLLWANFWQLAGLFAGAGELWLSFLLLQHPISLSAAVLLESLGQALRSVAFFMPAALGVQEGGFIFFGAVVGVGPELALAYSLLRRFRELALGLPLLMSWYVWEGQGLRRKWLGRQWSQEEGV